MRSPRHKVIRPRDMQDLREVHGRMLAICARLYPAGEPYRAAIRAAHAVRQCAIDWTGDEYAFASSDGAGRRRGAADELLLEARQPAPEAPDRT